MDTTLHATQAVGVISDEWPAIVESSIFSDLTFSWKYNHRKRAVLIKGQVMQDSKR
jgi:hypothetical protein